MTFEIPLPSGHTALVDDADEDLVSRFRWVALKSRSVNVTILYARSRVEPGSERRQFLHTLLTGWPLIDHVNGNGLDNRRENLRPCTRSQNGGNRLKHTPSSSRFKGVSVHPLDPTRWKATIGGQGVRRHLGLFSSEVEAALAYDRAARGQWGEFAALNFPEPGERSALAA